VVGVAAEVVFLRLLARAGIYIFQESSSEWLYTMYSTLVWLGSAALNFAAILIFALLLTLVVVLWQRGGKAFRLTALAMLVTLGLEGAIFLVSSSPGLSLAYVSSSTFLVGMALFLWCIGRGNPRMALTLGPLLAMFLASYWYKAVPQIHQLGWTGINGSVAAFQVSEGMLLLVAISLPLTVGVSRSLNVWVSSILFTLLLMGIYLAKPEVVPLVSTWAFGITLYLPPWTYAAALFGSSLAILTLLSRGHLLPACAFILLLISHRMLPLTYFNNLTLIALLLIVVTPWPLLLPLRQWQL
jgi:hypothetical protein